MYCPHYSFISAHLSIKHNYSTHFSNSKLGAKLGARVAPMEIKMTSMHKVQDVFYLRCLCPRLHEINKLSLHVSELAKMLALSYEIRHPSRYPWLTLSISHNLSLCPF